MERIFHFEQNRKTDAGKCLENYGIDVYHYGDSLLVELKYSFTYTRADSIKSNDDFTILTREVISENNINLNLVTGDFHVYSSMINRGFLGSSESPNRRNIKNKFKQLADITTTKFFGAVKNRRSVVYDKKSMEAFEVIRDVIRSRVENDYLKRKEYNKVQIDPLYDMIVDFHLEKKNIKGHDLVYLDIQEDYPKEKYLKINDRKFVPSVLDGYGIKTKQFIGVINNNDEGLPVIIKTLNYFCKLFGENYIDYLNKIDWHLHCYRPPESNKTHTLKNEIEKRNMVKVFNNWEKNELRIHSDITSDGSLMSGIYNILELREKIEKKGIEIKFTATDDHSIDVLYEEWVSLKKYLHKGYKIRYRFPDEFVQTIEKPIVVGDVVYEPKVLKDETDFKVEGHIMKNCMGKQFVHGIAAVYVSVRKGKRWVDVQYRKGERVMSYGKANSPLPSDFKIVVDTLDKRFKKFKTLSWVKERYDLIK